MAKDTIAPTPPTAQAIASAAFFAEAFGDSVGDATEILDGLQQLVWTMGARADALDETPAYMIQLSSSGGTTSRCCAARVAALALDTAPARGEVR